MPARKRELNDTGTDKAYIRRDEEGRYTSDQVDVGTSSEADQRQHTDTPAKPGHGDQGDRPKRR